MRWDRDRDAGGCRSYCGGTWKGIQNKLDYIQGMSANTPRLQIGCEGDCGR